jgi:ribosome-binding protein aMBF1 (putative translation factor)
MSKEFKVDITSLQKVQRSIRKSGNIFPNETKLVETLEELINSAQDDLALNAYHSMAQYLKQRLKDLNSHLESPQEIVQTAIEDLTWSIEYLQWLVAENKDFDL